MKYALVVGLDLEYAAIYFDRPVRDSKDTLNLDIGHMLDQKIPLLFRDLLGIRGVFSIAVRDNVLFVELLSCQTHFEPECSWSLIAHRMAARVAHAHEELVERASIQELFPSVLLPNALGRYPL